MMRNESVKPRLGRGLAALIGEAGDEMAVVDRGRGQRRVPIEFLRPNPRNPRKTFEPEDLERLSDSIQSRGIIQPIVVRGLPDMPDAYEIVAGERRWRAAQKAGLHDVPVVVVDIDDKTSLEFAIIENVQRSDLNAIEEAAGYERLMREFSYSATELAQVLGKSRSHVANTLRLLNLPEGVQAMVVNGALTAGHARALLAVGDPEAVARRVVEQSLTVREVERIGQEEQAGARPEGAGKARAGRVKPEKDADTRALEKALEDVLGLTVTIDHRGHGGELRIGYKTLEQLDSLCRRLNAAAAG
jgi:ParB family chromosome partitioning protein